jgi:N-acetyl-alpha-D-glucosaminyl L-malate synthase BshA
VTAVSRYLQKQTIAEFDIKREIRVIYNFIELDRPDRNRDACSRSDFAPLGEKILMHASNFRPVKRVDDVVRIFARVRERIPAKLLLIGDGPERPHIQQLVKEMNLASHVHFLGEQDQLEPLFFCTDLFLLPSEQESFGLTALEAMNCGVPVIASDVGGLPEVIVHGETGYLLPLGDVAGMASKAVELLSDPARHALFRTQARRRAEEHFDAVHIIPQYEALYEELLKT